MKAFDYTRQEWVNGAEAVTVALGQARATLALLEGDAGEAYAKFVGRDRVELQVEARRQVEALEVLS